MSHRAVAPGAPGEAAARPAAGTVTPAARLRSAEAAENFPVALRVLPRARREALRAVYDVVRTIDDVGDEDAVVGPSGTSATPAERLVMLDAIAADLDRVWGGGTATVPAVAALAPHVRDGLLPRDPFDDLVAANRADQRVIRYATREELRGYCLLSAVPIGRLVLAVFGVPATARMLARCDDVCVALQLLEHLQDVGEDRRRGRTYLPAEALADGGVDDGALDHGGAGFALRRVVVAETDRASALLRAASPVVGTLPGAARLAVAGYVAGGLAAADAIRRAGGEVLAGTPRRRRADVVRHLLRVLVRGRA